MDSSGKYYIAVIKLLTRRPHSEKEVIDYLLKKKAPQDILQAVVNKIKKEHFLDDLRFSRWWVQSRTRYKAKSDLVIRMELRKKGVDPEIVIKALSEKTDDYKTDFEKAGVVAAKYLKKISNLSKEKKYQRLGAYLSQKGFSYDTSKRVIDDILQKSYNNRRE